MITTVLQPGTCNHGRGGAFGSIGQNCIAAGERSRAPRDVGSLLNRRLHREALSHTPACFGDEIRAGVISSPLSSPWPWPRAGRFRAGTPSSKPTAVPDPRQPHGLRSARPAHPGGMPALFTMHRARSRTHSARPDMVNRAHRPHVHVTARPRRPRRVYLPGTQMCGRCRISPDCGTRTTAVPSRIRRAAAVRLRIGAERISRGAGPDRFARCLRAAWRS